MYGRVYGRGGGRDMSAAAAKGDGAHGHGAGSHEKAPDRTGARVDRRWIACCETFLMEARRAHGKGIFGILASVSTKFKREEELSPD